MAISVILSTGVTFLELTFHECDFITHVGDNLFWFLSRRHFSYFVFCYSVMLYLAAEPFQPNIGIDRLVTGVSEIFFHEVVDRMEQK